MIGDGIYRRLAASKIAGDVGALRIADDDDDILHGLFFCVYNLFEYSSMGGGFLWIKRQMSCLGGASDRNTLASQDIYASIEREANPLPYGPDGAPDGLDLA